MVEDELTWPEIENRLRKIIEESLDKLKVDIYERSFDPLKERVDLQERYCTMHSQQLTEVNTLTKELVDAKLIRRVEVAEAKIGLLGKASAVIGTAAASSIIGLIVLLLTHQITL